jgi:hypothetical protein
MQNPLPAQKRQRAGLRTKRATSPEAEDENQPSTSAATTQEEEVHRCAEISFRRTACQGFPHSIDRSLTSALEQEQDGGN